MRYGLVADIHGNLEALETVLKALSKESIDRYISLGDIVGYGAEPEACVALVRSLEPMASIAGNHEWGALALTDIENFNEYAREAILWTRRVLSRECLEYLRSFKLVCEGGRFTMVHGSLNSPERFSYILDIDDAHENMKSMTAPVCFIGHTHFAEIFYCEDGKLKRVAGSGVKIRKDGRYVVNVGSVGQPRDGDPRAAYAVYDDEKETVEIERVSYDIESASRKIIKEGLPERLALRLFEGR